jgi:hypothetical protein
MFGSEIDHPRSWSQVLLDNQMLIAETALTWRLLRRQLPAVVRLSYDDACWGHKGVEVGQKTALGGAGRAPSSNDWDSLTFLFISGLVLRLICTEKRRGISVVISACAQVAHLTELFGDAASAEAGFTGLFTTKFFQTLGCDQFPFQTACQLWDVLLAGHAAMMTTSVSVTDHHRGPPRPAPHPRDRWERQLRASVESVSWERAVVAIFTQTQRRRGGDASGAAPCSGYYQVYFMIRTAATTEIPLHFGSFHAWFSGAVLWLLPVPGAHTGDERALPQPRQAAAGRGARDPSMNHLPARAY